MLTDLRGVNSYRYCLLAQASQHGQIRDDCDSLVSKSGKLKRITHDSAGDIQQLSDWHYVPCRVVPQSDSYCSARTPFKRVCGGGRASDAGEVRRATRLTTEVEGGEDRVGLATDRAWIAALQQICLTFFVQCTYCGHHGARLHFDANPSNQGVDQ